MLTTHAKKILMAVTGIFLCIFLVVHLAGNLQLFLPPERVRLQFNWYSHLLSGNIVIKAISYVLYTSLLLHILDSAWLTIQSKRSTTKYQYDLRSRASKWYRRNMGVLGTIILIFLVIHFKNFWYVYKFGQLPLDEHGNTDLYTLVIATFQEWWYVLIYVLSMVGLGYHLLHGTYSAVRTLGLYHPRYARLLRQTGVVFSIIVSVGFALMPIYIFFTT